MRVRNASIKYAVITFSKKLGSCPAGKVVVSADRIPVPTPNKKAVFLSGYSSRPKNIITNIISGFIPKKNPGIIK